MADEDWAPVAPAAAALFDAAQRSLDAPQNLAFRRVLAVTLYVDADEALVEDASETIGDIAEQWARQILEQEGCTVVHRWGPHKGSHLVTLFGRTETSEDGGAFQSRLARISSRLSATLRHADWQGVAAKSGIAIKIVAHVGALAVLIVVTNAVVTHAVLGIPAGVFTILAIGDKSVDLARDVRALFWDNSVGRSLEEGSRMHATQMATPPFDPELQTKPKPDPRLRLDGPG